MEAAIKYENVEGNIIPFRSVSGDETSQAKRTSRESVSSEVFAYNAEDAHRMLEYMEQHEMWIHWLMLIAQLSIARRNSDMLKLKWKNFFDPKTGEFRRDMLEIKEKKTGKFAAPHISDTLKDAIRKYCRVTGCDVTANNYENPVFMQITGNYAGKVISYIGCIKALKRVAETLGIEYNVGTHSARKTFGASVLNLHPQDPRALEVVSGFYNHSNTRITEAYTGRTKKTVDHMVDEVGDFIGKYVVEGESFEMNVTSPVVTLASEDLRELLQAAYEAGRANAGNDDAMVHVQAFSELMAKAEEKIKR